MSNTKLVEVWHYYSTEMSLGVRAPVTYCSVSLTCEAQSQWWTWSPDGRCTREAIVQRFVCGNDWLLGKCSEKWRKKCRRMMSVLFLVSSIDIEPQRCNVYLGVNNVSKVQPFDRFARCNTKNICRHHFRSSLGEKLFWWLPGRDAGKWSSNKNNLIRRAQYGNVCGLEKNFYSSQIVSNNFLEDCRKDLQSSFGNND